MAASGPGPAPPAVVGGPGPPKRDVTIKHIHNLLTFVIRPGGGARSEPPRAPLWWEEPSPRGCPVHVETAGPIAMNPPILDDRCSETLSQSMGIEEPQGFRARPRDLPDSWSSITVLECVFSNRPLGGGFREGKMRRNWGLEPSSLSSSPLLSEAQVECLARLRRPPCDSSGRRQGRRRCRCPAA